LFIKDKTEIEYVRLLDSLARFYNSQITAHVGYELTIAVGLVAALVGLTSIIVGVCKNLWPVMVIIDILCIVAFLIVPVRPCWKHLYGQLQYYGQLSETTFEHMGLKTPCVRDNKKSVWRATDHVLRLRKRALEHEDGIEDGIVTLFEARLYVSRCIRERGDDQSTRERNLRETYHVTPDIVSASDDRYVKPVFFSERFARIFGWMYVDVLLVAYRQRKREIGEKRAALLFPDC